MDSVMQKPWENHLAVLVQQLCPSAAEIHLCLFAGQLHGFVRDAHGADLPLPKLSALDRAWRTYLPDTSSPEPPTLSALYAKLAHLEQRLDSTLVKTTSAP